eukprot:c15792_g1_i1.p1 GENE.c15792_g1_i1~~c15792_g1_i1.p1  ORF type:complete len:288 (-),score=-17.35 c15792_g1_i1:42-905(-)
METITKLMKLMPQIRDISNRLVFRWFEPGLRFDTDELLPAILNGLEAEVDRNQLKYLYIPYNIAYDELRANNIAENMAKDKIIKGIDQRLKKIDSSSDMFLGFLVRPVQRLMRYKSLLLEINKSYAIWTPDQIHTNLIQRVLDKVTEINDDINTGVNNFQMKKNLVHVIDIDKSIEYNKFEKGRIPDFVLEVDLHYVHSSSREEKLHAFVFKGFMVLAKSKGITSRDYNFVGSIYFNKIGETDKCPKKIGSHQQAIVLTDKDGISKHYFFAHKNKIDDLKIKYKSFE